MKKIISVILALVMVMGLSVTAMAEGPTSGKITITTNGQYSDPTGSDSTGKPGDSWNIAVPGGFTKIDPTDKNTDEVYYVEVEWDVKSTIEYQIGKDGYYWKLYDGVDATTPHKDGTPVKSAGYESKGDGWAGEATVALTVTSWSSRALKASTTFRGATTTDDATNIKKDITFAPKTGVVDSVVIDSATTMISNGETYTNKAVTKNMTVNIGMPTDGKIAGNTNVGYLTLTLAKNS